MQLQKYREEYQRERQNRDQKTEFRYFIMKKPPMNIVLWLVLVLKHLKVYFLFCLISL